MTRPRPTRSIRFTLRLSLATAVAIGVAVLVLSVFSSTRLIRSILREDMQQLSALTQAMLGRDLASCEDQAVQLAGANAWKVLLSLHLPAQARRRLESVLPSSRFTSLWLLDAKGRPLARAGDDRAPVTPPLSPQGRGARLLIVNGRLNAAAWAPVEDQGGLAGWLLALAPFPDADLMAELSRPDRSGLVLLDMDQILARSRWLQDAPAERLLQVQRDAQIKLPTTAGRSAYLVWSGPFQLSPEGPRLTAALVHNLAAARKPFLILAGLFIAGWVVVVVSFLALTRYVNVSLVKPVLRLARTADAIRGDKSPEIAFPDLGRRPGGNEITDLYHSFSEMVGSLHQAKLQAQEAENRFRSLYENAVEGVFQVDQNDCVLSANPALAHMLGYQTPEELLRALDGRVSSAFADPAQREQVKQLLLTHDRLLDYETRFVRRDGQEVWASLSARTVRDHSGAVTHYEGSLVDISERKRREAAEQGRQSAEAASQAKTRFLATMSHEIRTPLNAILGMADLLWETRLSMEQRDYVRIFRSSGELLLSLINDVLDLSRIESGEFSLNHEEFDLRDLVEKTGETMAAAAQSKGLELVCHMGAHVPAQVAGDPVRLRQILFNLLGNAVKFTNSGHVLLRTDFQPDPDDPERGLFRFTVQDTGIGIPADKLQRIFDRFTQADDSMIRRFGGSGLGLAIAKRLAGLMGGDVLVRSVVGQGSTFTCAVSLPVAPEQPPAVVPAWNRLQGVRVLAVEPHPVALEALQDHLEALGVKTASAGSIQQALEALPADPDHGAGVDLVLFESRLPDGSGVHLAEELARRRTRADTVILAPVTSPLAEREQARAAGVRTMVAKPVRLRKLASALCDALDGLSPRQAREETPTAVRGGNGNLRILLADDSDNNRLLIRHFLKKSGHTLLEAGDGEQAVETYRNHAVDLVLMDLEMPVLDGYTATRAIRDMEQQQGRAPAPIIALTAHAFKEVRDNCLEAGCTDFLSKPVPKKLLLERIDRIVAAG